MTKFSFENGPESESNNRDPKRLRTAAAPYPPAEQEDEADDEDEDDDEDDDDDDHDCEQQQRRRETDEDDDERTRRIRDDDEEERTEEEEEEEEEEEQQIGESSRTSSDGTTVFRSNNKRKRSICFTVDDDSDIFDCPVCFESLKIPVFQCENGHIACSSCCTKLHNKCPYCCFPIGYNRCRAMEKVIETVKVSCPNSQYGCKEKISYCKKDEHQERCLYTPSLCPLPHCTFFSSVKQISKHLNVKHYIQMIKFRQGCLFSMSLSKKDKFTFFLEENEASLFVLDNSVEERLGNALTINCIGPPVLSKAGLSYDIIAKTEGRTLRFQSVTEPCSARVSLPSTGLLLIPSDFTCSESFELDIYIRTNSTLQTGS